MERVMTAEYGAVQAEGLTVEEAEQYQAMKADTHTETHSGHHTREAGEDTEVPAAQTADQEGGS